jgi:hypothetical protein
MIKGHGDQAVHMKLLKYKTSKESYPHTQFKSMRLQNDTKKNSMLCPLQDLYQQYINNEIHKTAENAYGVYLSTCPLII